MHDVYLLLGSNLGHREQWLASARNLLEEQVGTIMKASSLYITASWGDNGQPDYINQVLLINTSRSAHTVLMQVLEIEQVLGRERKEKWGARIIDIDILFYANDIINDADLTVPHPYLHERRFALEPMKEIAPRLKHPVFKKTITYLYNALTDKLAVEQIKN